MNEPTTAERVDIPAEDLNKTEGDIYDVNTQASEAASASTGSTASSASEATTASMAEAATVAPVTKVELSDEAIRKMEETYGKRNAAPVKREFTPEEMQKHFKPHVVTGDHLKAMGFENPTVEQIAAYQLQINGIVTQAITTSNTINQQAMQELVNRIAPIQEEMELQRAQKDEISFYGTYPGLDTHRTAVRMAALETTDKKADGTIKTLAEIQVEVATRAQVILKEFGQDVDITKAKPKAGKEGAPPKQAATKPAVPKIASTSPPGKSQGMEHKQEVTSANNPDAAIYTKPT